MPIYLEELRPAHVDLRPFVLSSSITSVVPGGLTRAALRDGLARRQLLAGRRQQGHLGAACLMLSRVAESLYWTGRYIERAEDTSRLLHVNFHGLLDADLADRGQAWRELILLLGRDDVFREHFDGVHGAVGDRVHALASRPTRTPSRPASPARARTRAACASRSRARCGSCSTACTCSSRARARPRCWPRPHQFFVRIREASHAFQGVMKATLPRGEAYEFLELGAAPRARRRRRRACCREGARHPTAPSRRPVNTGALSALLQLVRRLRGLPQAGQRRAAARAGRRLPPARAQPAARGRFCLEQALSSIRAISGDALRPERAIGRVFAELSFTDLHTLDASTELLLERVRRGLADAAERDRRELLHDARDPARPLRPATAAAIDVPARRAHDRVQLRRLDRRGLHRAAAAPARGRRPALLVVPARRPSRSACACASTTTTSATTSTTSTCSSRTSGSP